MMDLNHQANLEKFIKLADDMGYHVSIRNNDNLPEEAYTSDYEPDLDVNGFNLDFRPCRANDDCPPWCPSSPQHPHSAECCYLKNNLRCQHVIPV